MVDRAHRHLHARLGIARMADVLVSSANHPHVLVAIATVTATNAVLVAG